MRRYILLGGLGLAIMLGSFPPLLAETPTSGETRHEASETLPLDLAQDSMRQLARRVIAKFGKERVYRIGVFQGPRENSPELRTLMSEAMKELGATVRDQQHFYSILGRFEAVGDPNSITGVRVSINVTDDRGRSIDNFDTSTTWNDQNSVSRILGVSSVIPSNVTPVVRAEMLAEQWESSPVYLVNHQVRTNPRSGYGVELLVREGERLVSRSLEADGPSGTSLVRFQDQELFAIRLLNYTSEEMAARIMIDGVDVFYRDDRVPRPKHHLIPPGSPGRPGTTTIQGWSFGEREVQWFRVGDLMSSVAVEAGLEDLTQVGQIVVQFSPTSLVDVDPGDDGARGYDQRRLPRYNEAPAMARSTGNAQGSRSVARMSASSANGGSSSRTPGHGIGRGPSQAVRTRVQNRKIDAAVATVVVRWAVE